MIDTKTVTDALAASRATAEADYMAAELAEAEARAAWDAARRNLNAAKIARDQHSRRAARVTVLLEQAADPDLTPAAQDRRRAEAEALARG